MKSSITKHWKRQVCSQKIINSLSKPSEHLSSQVNEESLEAQDKRLSEQKNAQQTAGATNDRISPRYNEYGIQMVSEKLSSQLFNDIDIVWDRGTFNKCITELKKFNLGKKKEPLPEVDLEIPKLFGRTIEEHFHKLGDIQSSPYKKLLNDLMCILPDLPESWVLEPGWHRYINGSCEPVAYPDDEALVFDVEVCKSEGEMPTLAVAASPRAWYAWVSPSLVSGVKKIKKNKYSLDELIPLESDNRNSSFKRHLSKARIVVGHNASFDRARVKEQYWLKKTGLRFFDTLSLHVSISGVTSYQKALLKAGVQESSWTKLTSLNNLSKVHELYCGSPISKEERDIFVYGSLTDVRKKFQSLVKYCAQDVIATHSVLKKMWPLFLNRFPHPVTMAGMLELQTAYVPVNDKWQKYLADTQATYEDLELERNCLLSQTAKSTCRLYHDDRFKSDMWMWDQNWTASHLKLKKQPTKKFIEKKDCTHPKNCDFNSISENYLKNLTSKFSLLISKTEKLLTARKPHIPGYPLWYTKLSEKSKDAGWVPGPNLLTNSMQITPKLLRLKWKSWPLHHLKGYGWGLIIPYKSGVDFHDPLLPVETLLNNVDFKSPMFCSCKNDSCVRIRTGTEKITHLDDLNPGSFCKKKCGDNFGFLKLPHKDGGHLNVGNPLARDFINKFSEEDLSDGLMNAKRIIEISKMLSYWRNNKERIDNQLVCWFTQNNLIINSLGVTEIIGAIIPQITVCGTLTRRAVEPTWMTASNSVLDRVGSEFRGIIEAPNGYKFVGADVDSEELWIASLLGDAHAAASHGCTPISWMTLNGHKADASDMHSVTAKAVGITRSHAKILNYARIYGAGLKFAERTLMNFNSEMTPADAKRKASKMYQLTKGRRVHTLKHSVLPQIFERNYTKFQALEICEMYGKNYEDLFESPIWINGTESEMFNSLENIANNPSPETPFLNCKLSRALEPSIDEDDKYGNTRVNWVVQSSAVDFLHLMLVCMKWLMGNKARFSLSFHDEVRYLVSDEFKYEAALALQITNLLSRAFCVSKVGMKDLPMSVAFFSSVEIDKVLRKDSHDDNVTPSNPYGLSKGYGIPRGESLNIYQCLSHLKIS